MGRAVGPDWGAFLAGERVERRLEAVLAADVAGYSRLMGRDERARWPSSRRSEGPCRSDHRRASRAHRQDHGDGMLVEFASAVDARDVPLKSSVPWPIRTPTCRMTQDRISHRRSLGDIIVDDGDIFGDGVNIAARLEGHRRAGGICVSDDAQRQIRGKVDLTFDDMGPQTSRISLEPMRAWRLDSQRFQRCPKPSDRGGHL